MTPAPLRLLLDTNLLISSLLNPQSDSPIPTILDAALAGTFTLLLPEQLVAEFADKIATKPYLAARISPEHAAAFIVDLAAIGEVIPTLQEPFPAVTRDPKDDYLLAYAVIGQADYLVSGDRDLLDLGPVEGLTILSPADCAHTLEAPGPGSV